MMISVGFSFFIWMARRNATFNYAPVAYIPISAYLTYTLSFPRHLGLYGVGTLIVATIYLQLIQNRYMFRCFTVIQCSHQHCVQPAYESSGSHKGLYIYIYIYRERERYIYMSLGFIRLKWWILLMHGVTMKFTFLNICDMKIVLERSNI